ncbi:hypothetical protein ABTX81_24785 [Kitasatospora sp. NPDC097605]|uniref:DUF7919 family protein n=1 Tax=Kitasatospora sp. NPDC097605 TaxID=3157226 RepID=UPI00331BF788
MTFFPDLSPYSYLAEDGVAHAGGSYYASFVPSRRRINVGWLSGRHGYTTGPVPDGFLVRLLDIRRWQNVNLTRGFHVCELCPPGKEKAGLLTVEHKGDVLHLGNGEIRVPGTSGEVFAAPTLIAHYVDGHDYLPPVSFIDAVLLCPDGWMSGPDAPGVPADATRYDYRSPGDGGDGGDARRP